MRGRAAWLPDGTIVYSPVCSDGLFRISAQGGTPERLTLPDHKAGEYGHWYASPLPGRRAVLFTAFRSPADRSRVGVLDLDTREVRWVVEAGYSARYVSTGHLVYGKGRRLYAQPFDPASLAATGPAVAVLDDIRTSPTAGAAVSNAGTLAYVTELLGNPPRELIWLDRSGHVLQAVGERRRYLSVSLSPDDAHAALTIQGDSQDLWVLSLARGTLSRMTSGDATEFDPTWSPRGAELFYVMDRPQFDLHRIGLGRTDSGRPLWHDRVEVDTLGPAVSHDGRMATRLRRLIAIGAV